METVQFIGREGLAHPGNVTSATFVWPSSAQDDDLLILQLISSKEATTLSEGWEVLHRMTPSTNHHLIATKKKRPGETSVDVTFSGATTYVGVISVFRNVKEIVLTSTRSVVSGTAFTPITETAVSVTQQRTMFLLLEMAENDVTFERPSEYDYLASFQSQSRTFAWYGRQMHSGAGATQTATQLRATATAFTRGTCTLLVLEPITNNSPTLTLTSPANNQTLSEGSSYPVEGSATDADAGNVVTVKYQINNGPVRALQSGVSDGSTPISFARTLTYHNKRIWDGSTDVIGVDLSENTDHILKVWAEDDQGGKSAEVTRTYRVVHNRPPVISGENGDLGIFEVAPTVSYTVSDPEGNGFTVTEKLNGNVIRSFVGVANRQETLAIPFDKWLRLEPGVLHSLTIEATDSQGATSVRTYTLTRFEDEIEFEIETPWVTDVAAKRVLLTLDMTLPAGAELTAEACNNPFDTTPAWEDISFYARYGRGYVFQNTQKTAAQWGVSIRVRIRKGTATEPVVVKGFGGAFD